MDEGDGDISVYIKCFSSYLKFTWYIYGGRVYPCDGWTQGWLLDPYAFSKIRIRRAVFTSDTPEKDEAVIKWTWVISHDFV